MNPLMNSAALMRKECFTKTTGSIISQARPFRRIECKGIYVKRVGGCSDDLRTFSSALNVKL